MERRSRFTFGAQSFEATISAAAWVPADRTVGGARIAASGVPASYVVRRDALLTLTLRIWESEWVAVANLIVWGQSAQTITWAPDATAPATTYAVYLDSPAPGETFAPTRSADFPRVYEVTITVRGASGAVPWPLYFEMAT